MIKLSIFNERMASHKKKNKGFRLGYSSWINNPNIWEVDHDTN